MNINIIFIRYRKLKTYLLFFLLQGKDNYLLNRLFLILSRYYTIKGLIFLLVYYVRYENIRFA